ncbi:STAS domain-containing protein [Pontibacillus yanchengensis]|uniref:STAS domain-containing protein n=1 Tax=Pontibacillus yanchengensis Y32 TaxID=1385514 RepID=A0A0A2TEM3_9BACI|nr:STAS domain-containing protein [Pontibacillus yanchengensis]KGP72561.1 hypothetical protein N782_11825 [Pontibacillus yanchengensis Y32]
MQQVHDQMPLPLLQINTKFDTLQYTPEASEVFDITENFLNMVDEGSKSKVEKWIHPSQGKSMLEINVYGKSSDVVLTEVYVRWLNDLHAEVILHPKEKQNEHITTMLDKLQNRLNDTNFALLEEKEKVEDTLKENHRLSAPFIQLTEGIAFVPLFGDLSEEKLFTIKEQVLAEAHNYQTDRILFDFTAVGELDAEGFCVLNDVFKTLDFMGKEIVLIGVKPNHSMKINEFKVQLNIQFLHSLQTAIYRYCSR